MQLYGEYAWIWELMRDDTMFQEEVDSIVQIAESQLQRPIQSMLELGSGGGYLARCVPDAIEMVLVDMAPDMLRISEQRQPTRQHICADMTSVDLGRVFDVVLVHDAIMYVDSIESAERLLHNIRKHLANDGVAIIIPDVVSESFMEKALHTESASNDGLVQLQFTEWHWDRNPEDHKVQVEFSILIRDHRDVETERVQVKALHETHDMLVLSFMEWMELFAKAQLQQILPTEHFWCGGGEFFLLTKGYGIAN